MKSAHLLPGQYLDDLRNAWSCAIQCFDFALYVNCYSNYSYDSSYFQALQRIIKRASWDMHGVDSVVRKVGRAQMYHKGH